ncbi:MAG TPA: Ig-like domain-containing protein [Gemmatimonadales bacterium]|nr:Ig-like domain-containing protein [Gemmatimonadales bacterium]
MPRRSTLALLALVTGAHGDCRVIAGAEGFCGAVRLEPRRARLAVGETLRLRVNAVRCEAGFDCGCDGIGRHRFHWRSSAPAVAAVDSTGSVRALAPGRALVAAADQAGAPLDEVPVTVAGTP